MHDQLKCHKFQPEVDSTAYEFALKQAADIQQESKENFLPRSGKMKTVLERVAAIHAQTAPIVFNRHSNSTEAIHKLITVEKLLVSQHSYEAMKAKFFNGFQLMTCYFKLSDYVRIVKYYQKELSAEV